MRKRLLFAFVFFWWWEAAPVLHRQRTYRWADGLRPDSSHSGCVPSTLRTPGFTSGTCPQVTVARPHPPGLPGPVPVSRPGLGVSPVPLRQAWASWGRDRDLGRAREGEGVSPRGPRKGKGSREPLPLGLLELPALWERRPRLCQKLAFLEGRGKV